MVRQNMLRSTIWLTTSGVLVKAVDFGFRAFYSARLGSEGMGIFSLCFAVHGIMLNIATGGLGIAVSKTVSECYVAGRLDDAKKTIRIALTSVSIMSLAVIFLAVIYSGRIASGFLKEPRCRLSLICIAPSVLFMGLSYCIKGYFYATRKILIPASSEFLEQAVKLSSITFLLAKLLPRGVEYGCMAVFLGISIGEFSSCIYLLIFYTLGLRKRGNRMSGTAGPVLAPLLKASVPIMTTSLAGSFLRMQEQVLVVSSLKKTGLLQTEALSVYGAVHGMAMPLIVFPLTLLSSCFTLLVPEISRAYSMKNRLRLQTLVSRLYRFCALFGFFVLCVFWIFGEKLSVLVYNTQEISGLLKILAVISPMMFIDSISSGILNGMGKQSRLLFFSLLDSGTRIVLIYFLMPRYGISALLLIIIFSNALTFLMTYKSVIKFSEIGVGSFGRVWRHIVTAAFTAAISVQFFSGQGTVPETVFEILVTGGIYFALSLIFGAAKKSDFGWLLSRMFF